MCQLDLALGPDPWLRPDPWLPGFPWIDEDIKQETLEARKAGRVYPPVTKFYEDWREN